MEHFSDIDLSSEKCLSYMNKEDYIMKQFVKSKDQMDHFEEKLEKVSTQNIIFEPSQNKTEVCSQTLTIFSETINSFLIICNLKESIDKLKMLYNNPRLFAFLNEYVNTIAFMTKLLGNGESSSVLSAFINKEKRKFAVKRLDLNNKYLNNVQKKWMDHDFNDYFDFDSMEMKETEFLRLFKDDKSIEHNEDEMNIHKLIGRIEYPLVDLEDMPKVEKIDEKFTDVLSQKHVVNKKRFYRLNALRLSCGINDDAIRNLCKNILRETKREVARKHHSIAGFYNDQHPIIQHFKSLANIVTRKLEKHPIQYYIEKIYFEHVKDRTRNYAAIAEMLENKKKDISEKNSIQVILYLLMYVANS